MLKTSRNEKVGPAPFEQEPKVRCWMESVRKGGCTIRSMTALNLFHKKGGELLFALLQADIVDPHGNRIPDILFLRGHSCVIVPLLVNKATGEEKFLMIRQRRIGNGALNLEFPAGMLDDDIDDPTSVAQRELFEETGLSLPRTVIRPLCDRPLLCSPGASDEGIYYFGCRIELDASEFTAFEGRIISNENEQITVTLQSRKQAEAEATSLQVRLGLYLFYDMPIFKEL